VTTTRPDEQVECQFPPLSLFSAEPSDALIEYQIEITRLLVFLSTNEHSTLI